MINIFSWNKMLTILCILAISGCKQRPTFSQMEQLFSDNRTIFNEFSKKICEMGKVKQPFSFRKEYFIYRPERVESSHRLVWLENYLDVLKAESIVFQERPNGECSISVFIHTEGLAGAGIDYSFRYNPEKLSKYDSEIHKMEAIRESKRPETRFDKKLDDNWYFSFYKF